MNENVKKAKRRTSQKARRRFLRSVLYGAGAVGVALLGYLPVVGQWITRLRPPGALNEDKFLAACIKCGQCVQVCPVEAIRLADLTFPVTACSACWPVPPGR